MKIAQEPLPAEAELGVALDVVAILVAIVLGAIAVWAAFRAARPRRRLYVSCEQVPKNWFDGEPLKIDFGIPVVALLKMTSSSGRKAVAIPEVKITDTAVLIGPALITRSHVFQCTMLVDGVPELTLAGSPADVHVHYERAADSYAGMQRRRDSTEIWTLIGGVTGLVAVVISILIVAL